VVAGGDGSVRIRRIGCPASGASSPSFYVVDTGGDGRVHDNAFDTTAKKWEDQIVPNSVPARS
jgi:hypothetical protein